MTPESGKPPASDFATVIISGFNAAMLDAEHAAGAGEAGLHFVGDQQDAMAVTDLTQRHQEFVRCAS